MNDQNPRQIAAQVLQQRNVSSGRFIEDLLEHALESSSSAKHDGKNSRTRTTDEDEDEKKMPSADRALCQELVYGVVRWQATLDWLIARKTEGRKQKPPLQNLLRLGLYQIFWLDRIPGHAAVNETVKLARKNGFASQTGFVNAVLRTYLREADSTRKLIRDLKLADPATGYSHPRWLVERWRKRFGAERTRQLLEWNNTPPKAFARANTLKLGEARDSARAEGGASVPAGRPDALLARWREEGVEQDAVRRDWFAEHLVFELKSHPSIASLGSFQQGWFYVQDPSTLLAPSMLGAQPGETVLDFCAAPGGKTAYLAQLMNNQGQILAQDVSAERLKLAEENCRRLGVTCVQTILSSALNAQTASRFDRILVDAPCSNSGVMRRRVDLRWRIRPEEITRLQRMQLNLLNQAATKLKPGGVLIYSTCSLEPEENGEVVKAFLASHADFQLKDERELLPFIDGVDGAYAARLRRK